MSRTGLTRELLRWILSLGLSHPIKNARRDFSNGYLLAEILQRYYPQEVALHSFDNGATSEKRKRDNWRQLEKICKKKGLKLSPKAIEGVMNCKEEALISLLESVYKKVTSPDASSEKKEPRSGSTTRKPKGEARESLEGEVNSYATRLEMDMRSDARRAMPRTESGMVAREQVHEQQHFMQAEDSYDMYSQFRIKPMHPMNEYGGAHGSEEMMGAQFSHNRGASDYPAPGTYQQNWDPFDFGKYTYERAAPIVASVASAPIERPYPVERPYPDEFLGPSSPYSYSQEKDIHHTPVSASKTPSSYYGGGMPLPYSSVTGKENAESPKFGSKYSSLPVEETSPGYSSRPSEKPKDGQGQGADYSAKYSQQQRYKHADVKGSKYWELGKLGPDLERKEIVQKRSARDKMKEFSSEIRKNNARATRKSAKGGRSEKDASTLDSSKAYSARQRALEFAKNIRKPAPLQRASTSPQKTSKNTADSKFDELSELDRLMVQHEADSQQINLMRNQLERQLKLAST